MPSMLLAMGVPYSNPCPSWLFSAFFSLVDSICWELRKLSHGLSCKLLYMHCCVDFTLMLLTMCCASLCLCVLNRRPVCCPMPMVCSSSVWFPISSFPSSIPWPSSMRNALEVTNRNEGVLGSCEPFFFSNIWIHVILSFRSSAAEGFHPWPTSFLLYALSRHVLNSIMYSSSQSGLSRWFLWCLTVPCYYCQMLRPWHTSLSSFTHSLEYSLTFGHWRAHTCIWGCLLHSFLDNIYFSSASSTGVQPHEVIWAGPAGAERTQVARCSARSSEVFCVVAVFWTCYFMLGPVQI